MNWIFKKETINEYDLRGWRFTFLSIFTFEIMECRINGYHIQIGPGIKPLYICITIGGWDFE
jgi:hypothetical protein